VQFLPSIAELSDHKYKNVVHYEEKAAVRAYTAESVLRHASLLPAFSENLNTRPLIKNPDAAQDKDSAPDKYTLILPIFNPSDTQAWV
jgi:hypothetical protein